MNRFRRWYVIWFGHSRRERRASFILAGIVFVLLSVRYLVNTEPSEIKIEVLKSEDNAGLTSDESVRAPENDSLFRFDPNNVGYEELLLLGLPEKTARTLIRYRSNGGHFREAGDIRKIYGLDSSLAGRLIPLIYIAGNKKSELISVMTYDTENVVADIKKPGIELNSCDSAQIENEFRIKHSLAVRITRYRDLLGGFTDKGQLTEVYGMNDSIFKIIARVSYVDSARIRKISINKADYRELERHPYIEKYEAQSIIKYRELTGRIKNTSELVVNNILTRDKAARIIPYLNFE